MMKKTHYTAALLTTTLLTFGSLPREAQAAAFTIANPYRHFQHQFLDKTKKPPQWTYKFDGCCYVTSAATVAMSIADNNKGIQLNGFENSGKGAEDFEKTYRSGGTIANKVQVIGNVPLWDGWHGNWVNAPWFQGTDQPKLQVTNYYYGSRNWDNIPTTLPKLNVVGAFALIDEKEPQDEWWRYHVVGVYEFDFEGKQMKITDSNKDIKGNEVDITETCVPLACKPGDILKPVKPPGTFPLDTLTWNDTGILTNQNGKGIDDEQLVSLRVIHLVPEPLTILGTFTVLGLLPLFKTYHR